jgi:hypothetical protein
MQDDPEPYGGAFVVLSPDPLGYKVSIDPPPPGDDPTRTFSDKHSAWGYASLCWQELRCPLRDLTEHNTARAEADRREKSDSSF